MARRTSGLGRGLGDLLADNAPELRGGATVVRRDEDGEVTITPDAVDAAETESAEELLAADAITDPKNAKEDREEKWAQAPTEEPIVIFPVSSMDEEFATSSTKNVEMTVEKVASDNGETASAQHPHRSLKALFKSYK